MRVYKGKHINFLPDDYTVVDIETNGMDVNCCEIIETSAVRFRANERTAAFSCLIKPKSKISPFVTRLTGITDAMAQGGRELLPALTDFSDFLGDDIIMGYNVNFDINFLYDNILSELGFPLKNDYFDVLRMARRTLPALVNHKQTTVAEFFGIDTDGAHRAEKDCLICADVYIKLRKSLSGIRP